MEVKHGLHTVEEADSILWGYYLGEETIVGIMFDADTGEYIWSFMRQLAGTKQLFENLKEFRSLDEWASTLSDVMEIDPNGEYEAIKRGDRSFLGKSRTYHYTRDGYWIIVEYHSPRMGANGYDQKEITDIIIWMV